ncbi:unnamed protein product [Schistosoma intercalatum]|nr:unnamed protein product [Schistosoma intercalatum]
MAEQTVQLYGFATPCGVWCGIDALNKGTHNLKNERSNWLCIAVSLGKSGATVYLTGRTSVPLNGGIGGSLQETSDIINNFGGKAIPVMVDHSNENEIENLFHQIDREQKGRLDIKNMGKPYYEITDISPGEAWDVVNDTGLKNHYICSVLATRMMIEYQKKTNPSSARPGLIVNITSVGGKIYLFSVSYGSGNKALDRITHDMALELRRENVNISIVGISPGLVRTEHILDAASKGSLTMNIENSQSPELVGRVVVGMAAESPKKLLSRSGHIFLVSDLAEEYGIHEDCGREIVNVRSLKYLLSYKGYYIAKFIPSFIRIPEWLFYIMLKYR